MHVCLRLVCCSLCLRRVIDVCVCRLFVVLFALVTCACLCVVDGCCSCLRFVNEICVCRLLVMMAVFVVVCLFVCVFVFVVAGV